MSGGKTMKYFVQHFPIWHCSRCGRGYTSLENYCFFCSKKKPKEPLPPRHQFKELPTQPVGREFYLGGINLDYFER